MRNPIRSMPDWALRAESPSPVSSTWASLVDLSQDPGSTPRPRKNSDEVRDHAVWPSSSEYMDIDGGDIVEGRWFTQHRGGSAAAAGGHRSTRPRPLDLFGGQGSARSERIRIIGSSEPGPEPVHHVIGLYRPPAEPLRGLQQSHYVMVPFDIRSDKYMNGSGTAMIWFVVSSPEPGACRSKTSLDVVRTRGCGRLRGLGPNEVRKMTSRS